MPTQVKARKPAPQRAPEVEEIPAPSASDVLEATKAFIDEVDALLDELGYVAADYLAKGGE